MNNTQVQLTPKQQEFYDIFWQRAFIPGRINWPTVREMQSELGLSQPNQALRYMNELCKHGYLVQDAPRESFRLPGWRFVVRLEEVDEAVV